MSVAVAAPDARIGEGRALLAVVLGASVASTIGGLPFNSLPVMLGSLAESFALAPAAVGWMGSICFAGYLLGTLGAPFWMNRLNWRLLTVLSALATACAFAASAAVRDVRMLYAIWALIGFFASTMTCLGMRVLSDLPNKVRAYGIRQGTELSVTAAVLFALPPLAIAHWHYAGAALALAAVVALLGVSALWVPSGPQTPAALIVAGTTAVRLPLPSVVSLLVFFMFLVGNIGLWAFLQRIGAKLEIAPAGMGLVFAVLKLLGGVAAFTMAIVGERAAERSVVLLITILIAAGLALLGAGGTFVSYAAGAWIWEFAFTCGCVLQTARIARSDPGGRAVVLVPAVFAGSSMVGPALAGLLAADGGFTLVLGLAAASTLVLPVAIWTGAVLRRRRLQAAPPRLDATDSARI